MSVRRKLFLAMAVCILGMSLLFIFLTQTVVWGIIHAKLQPDRTALLSRLSQYLASQYEANGSWENVNPPESGQLDEPGAGFLLVSPKDEAILSAGEASEAAIRRLGIRVPVAAGGVTAAFLYYIDQEVENSSIVRIGISSSVTFLMIAGAVLFTLMALAFAYWMSRKLTSPLKEILPAIEKLGEGEYGVQSPVVSNDEYGTLAKAFNEMSAQMKRYEDARRNLTADVAHELRTPLTIIRGKLELLQQEGRAVEPESLLPMHDELIRLTRLVDDLQQLSLAEARKLPLERKPVNLTELLRRVVERFAPEAEQKRLTVDLLCSREPPLIYADPNRLAQVFLNLFGNAIRYTPEGGEIEVRIEEVPPLGGQTGMVEVTVKDSGPGIAPEHLPYLFDRFYRTDEARARGSGGMGLGLAIAKQLVLSHDGTIEAQSSPGQGTAMIVRLPLNDS
jgi:two-component system sensor histidine kinase BaeS